VIGQGWRLSRQPHALRDVTIELPGIDEPIEP